MTIQAKPRTFELGLVMAGAISAGAYTAGVMDFLIQALDAWYDEKADRDAPVLRHDLSIRVISGASAGAMTSALSAVTFKSEIDPVVDAFNPPAPKRNRLYDAWVRKIDISRLLTTTDIGPSGKTRSLLNAVPLEEIANEALDAPSRPQGRPYVSDPLLIALSVANLRGVPYGIHLRGESAKIGYGMYEHADHLRFALTWAKQGLPGAWDLPAEGLSNAPGEGWKLLVNAALASGAFPFGFAPRFVDRPRSHYDERHSHKPLFTGDGESYRFLCVDGGLMNNEPLELARQHLSGGRTSHNAQAGDKAYRAVVLIDPFPNEAPLSEPYEPDEALSSIGLAIFRALKNQARFKSDELDLAMRPDVYSRFMISPSRNDDDDKPIEPAIASGVLDGFGGFLHESFRRHDFQLGRRNCQAFLKWQFCLPESNPIFAGMDNDIKTRFYVRDHSERVEKYRKEDGTEENFLPIIPLVGSAAKSVDKYPAPSGDVVDLALIKQLLVDRMRAVGRNLIRSDLEPLFGKAIAITAEQAWAAFGAAKLGSKAMDALKVRLEKVK